MWQRRARVLIGLGIQGVVAMGRAPCALAADPPPAAPEAPAQPAVPAVPTAPPPGGEPGRVSGIERAASYPDDELRTASQALLYVPRAALDLLFLPTGMIEGEQIVPRVSQLVDPRPGRIGVYPTLFAETGGTPSVGVRMIANLDGRTSTGLRFGWGGPHDLGSGARILVNRPSPYATTISVEGSYDLRSEREYRGVGQRPDSDERNHFRDPGGTHEALFSERRLRLIASLGVRPNDDVEAFLSSSLTKRDVGDPPDRGPASLSRIFELGSVPGAFVQSTLSYSEIALRFDTREGRGGPTPGVSVEGYYGAAGGVGGAPTAFMRTGGVAAAFLPIFKRTNILSPKLALDAIAPFGDATIPFAELPRQPEFRGYDTRRDNVSVVGSLDYRWRVIRYVAARLFVDVATVAPSLGGLSPGDVRYASGFGVDFSSNLAELGRLAVAASPEGYRVTLSLGVQSAFGDRQHRD